MLDLTGGVGGRGTPTGMVFGRGGAGGTRLILKEELPATVCVFSSCLEDAVGVDFF